MSSTGETVPLSDDEDEAVGDDSPQKADRQEEEFVIDAIFTTLGRGDDVVKMTAKQLKLPEGKVIGLLSGVLQAHSERAAN